MRTGTSRPHPVSRAPRRAPRRHRLLTVVAALTLGVAAVGVPAQADERQDAVERQEEAERKQAEITASLEGVSASLGQAYLDLQAAETALSTAQAELDAAETTLAAKEREQQLAADRLAVAEADLAEIEEEAQASQATAEENSASVAELVVSAYQGDSTVTTWTYVLDSESVEELSQRASTMEIAAGVQESVLAAAEADRAQDANRQARQDATTTRVATLKAEADEAEAAAQTARDDAATYRDEVAALTTERQTAAAQLETEKAGLEAQQAQAAADAAAAADTIARIDAENQASAGYTGASSDEAAASSLGGGDIGHPITGSLVVASPFGYRIHPITGLPRLHAGVDLVAGQGVPQYAAVSGTVTYNINSSCGNGIFINGGVINGQSVVVAYCHLSQITVGNGSSVSKGQQIGLTGATGGATGPHVHFEVILNGSEVDPMTLPGF